MFKEKRMKTHHQRMKGRNEKIKLKKCATRYYKKVQIKVMYNLENSRDNNIETKVGYPKITYAKKKLLQCENENS